MKNRDWSKLVKSGELVGCDRKSCINCRSGICIGGHRRCEARVLPGQITLEGTDTIFDEENGILVVFGVIE